MILECGHFTDGHIVAELDALLPTVLERAFRGELQTTSTTKYPYSLNAQSEIR
ncbi:MAG TPA: hypothetical protein VLB04_04780 [Methanotrichaceae archaeon]|nr:hypothetical protein [Methanotrichaceae archaeon]